MGRFQVIGLSELQEQLFDSLVREGSATAGELAHRCGAAVEEAGAGIGKLQDLGMVFADPGEGGTFSAAPVEPAVEALVQERLRDLGEVRELAKTLAAQARARQTELRPEQLVAVVVGTAAVTALAQQLQAQAEHEVVMLDRPPYYTTYSGSGEGTDPQQHTQMARGVRYRTVADSSLLDDPAILARIQRDIAAGEDTRVLTGLPLKLLLVDRRVAIVPLLTDPNLGPPAALFIQPSVLVDSLAALFDALWGVASPLPGHEDGSVEAGHAELASLMAAGLSDSRIARTLGISERTLRRRTSDLLDHLGVATRFQAALAARDRGWV